MTTKRGKEIQRLYFIEGKSYRELEKMGYPKSLCNYYCTEDGKEKVRLRNQKNRQESERMIVNKKIDQFMRPYKGEPTSEDKKFTYDDVIKKYPDGVSCYLTGRKIDLTKRNSFSLDHVIPKSKGGPNNIDNMRIAYMQANQAKNDMILDDFIEMCHEIAAKHPL